MNSEKENIKLFKSGSTKAFEALYTLYNSRLYGYCFQWTKSQDDSQEIVQDVFTNLWQSRKEIKEENTLLFYIFRIAKNQLINRYRRNLKSPIFEEYVQYTNEVNLSSTHTDEPLLYDEFCRKIDQIKTKLPKTQQLVFEYSIFQQKTNKEIAQLLDMSEQTIKNQLSLALKTFRLKLSKHHYMIIWMFLLLK